MENRDENRLSALPAPSWANANHREESSPSVTPTQLVGPAIIATNSQQENSSVNPSFSPYQKFNRLWPAGRPALSPRANGVSPITNGAAQFFKSPTSASPKSTPSTVQKKLTRPPAPVTKRSLSSEFSGEDEAQKKIKPQQTIDDVAKRFESILEDERSKLKSLLPQESNFENAEDSSLLTQVTMFKIILLTDSYISTYQSLYEQVVSTTCANENTKNDLLQIIQTRIDNRHQYRDDYKTAYDKHDRELQALVDHFVLQPSNQQEASVIKFIREQLQPTMQSLFLPKLDETANFRRAITIAVEALAEVERKKYTITSRASLKTGGSNVEDFSVKTWASALGNAFRQGSLMEEKTSQQSRWSYSVFHHKKEQRPTPMEGEVYWESPPKNIDWSF